MTPELMSNAEDSCLKNHIGSVQHDGPISSTSSNGPLDESEKTEQGPLQDTPGYDGRPTHGLDHEASSSDLEEPFPEGGLQAWLVVFGSFCAMFCIFGLINTSGVFEAYFKANQLRDYTHSQIGWIFSLYLFLVFFVGIQVGPIFDRFGPRILVAAGTLLIVISLMLLSLSKSKSQLGFVDLDIV